ncbi:MAG: flagellar transcriptional regulator FlhD [Rhodoferax sp.]|uniref:flagellar transcriptional regulator FlhD n=1 Tax=Rhodoferax sp. TaxID=50421 RepID=UPI002ACD9956|nr:flagellar transcriptional regulator FlhD [Rhodoferax sp.]MDZ7891085.1 flagellar transcriptional regulator FlhD [Rhodoferax sp.]
MKAQIKAEIRDANMAYLNMAQSFIQKDLQSAVKILGMSQDAAEIIKTLSESQKTSIADSDILLCRFGVSDDVVWTLLTSHPAPKPEAEHAKRLLADILLAGRLVVPA